MKDHPQLSDRLIWRRHAALAAVMVVPHTLMGMTTTDARKRLAENQAKLAQLSTSIAQVTELTKSRHEEFVKLRDYTYRLARIVGLAETVEGYGEILHPLDDWQYVWNDLKDAASSHAECPSRCEDCGERLATDCPTCHGAGGNFNLVASYDTCDECDGKGVVHTGCTGETYAVLSGRAAKAEAAIERVRLLAGSWREQGNGDTLASQLVAVLESDGKDD